MHVCIRIRPSFANNCLPFSVSIHIGVANDEFFSFFVFEAASRGFVMFVVIEFDPIPAPLYTTIEHILVKKKKTRNADRDIEKRARFVRQCMFCFCSRHLIYVSMFE